METDKQPNHLPAQHAEARNLYIKGLIKRLALIGLFTGWTIPLSISVHRFLAIHFSKYVTQSDINSVETPFYVSMLWIGVAVALSVLRAQRAIEARHDIERPK